MRVSIWNFSGLCSDRKQKEVEELLAKHNLDVAGQESWEKEESGIEVEGYKWFGKPRSKQNSPRGEGGVGFLVCECLANAVVVQCLDKEGALHEGQAGFRLNRGCMDNVYTLNEIVQGRLREDKKTCILFRYTENL